MLEAVDALGNRNVLQRRVVLDSVGPELSLEPPLDAAVWHTSSPVLVVRGRTEPGATVTVDGLPGGPLRTTAGSDGQLEGLVALLPDESLPLTVTAQDDAGNVTVAHRWVAMDRQPPAIQLTEPGPLPYVEQSPLRLAGRTEPGTLLVLRHSEVEQRTVAGVNGAFVFETVEVADGRNGMVLTATDALGNTRLVPIDVYARLSPLWLQVTEPEQGWQSAAPARLALVAEADATLQATLDGQPLQDWTLAPPVAAYDGPTVRNPAVTVYPTGVPRPSVDQPPAELSDDPPWRAALVALPALTPGPHQLVVEAVSPTGLRHARISRSIHVPGVPRTVLVWSAERRGDGVLVTAQALDAWDLPVADGTPVEFRAPAGWLIDGREAVAVPTVRGEVKAVLQPVRWPRRGVALVSVGRVTESVRLPVW